MRRGLLFALLIAALAPAAGAADDPLDQLVTWLAGDWDNRQQAEDDRASGVDPFDRHPRRARVYLRVEAPAVAGRLFAVRHYESGGLDGSVTGVGLERFTPSPVTTEIVHEVVYLQDPAAWGDLRRSLDALGGLRDGDLRSDRRCRVYWRRVGDHFEGRTRPGRCRETGENGGERRIERFAALYADRLVRHEQHYGPDDALLPRPGGRTPQVFLKR